MKGTKVFFPNLDGLRTVACLMVFAFHALGIGHNRLGIGNFYLERLVATFLNGKTGVSIFFVLSGFLITYIMLSEIMQTGHFSLRDFYIRRVLRIWPLYFSVLLIIFVALPVLDHFLSLSRSAADTRPFYYFVFLSNFDVLRIFENGGSDFLPSTITWSVAIEEQFYLFWPLLFLVVPANYYKYLFIGVIAIALCYRILHFNQAFKLYFHSLSAAADLSIGGATAWLCSKGDQLKKKIQAASDTSRIIFLFTGFAVMYINMLVQSATIHLLLGIAQAVFFAWIIADQCFNQSTKLKFSHSRTFSKLGKFTYGIYMLHPLVLLVINVIMVRLLHNTVDNLLSLAVGFIAGLPLTIGLAALSYQYLEKPFLAMKERFTVIPSFAPNAYK